MSHMISSGKYFEPRHSAPLWSCSQIICEDLTSVMCTVAGCLQRDACRRDGLGCAGGAACQILTCQHVTLGTGMDFIDFCWKYAGCIEPLVLGRAEGRDAHTTLTLVQATPGLSTSIIMKVQFRRSQNRGGTPPRSAPC